MKTCRVLICDDHAMIREGLRALLDENPNLEVVGEADNGREVVRLCTLLNPDVVIMDIGMPELNGIEATRLIKAQRPAIRVVALTMHSSRRLVKEMLRAGAIGYVLKSSAFDELAAALDFACRDKPYISPSLAGVVLEEFNGRGDGPFPQPELTPREREVLQLLAEGHGIKDIAARLYMSENTAQTHRRNIMEKLNIYSIAQLTKFAIREGITSPED
ncbi:MAG: response regulator transcription factor [Thermodesulfobacteriota bacterium]